MEGGDAARIRALHGASHASPRRRPRRAGIGGRPRPRGFLQSGDPRRRLGPAPEAGLREGGALSLRRSRSGDRALAHNRTCGRAGRPERGKLSDPRARPVLSGGEAGLGAAGWHGDARHGARRPRRTGAGLPPAPARRRLAPGRGPLRGRAVCDGGPQGLAEAVLDADLSAPEARAGPREPVPGAPGRTDPGPVLRDGRNRDRGGTPRDAGRRVRPPTEDGGRDLVRPRPLWPSRGDVRRGHRRRPPPREKGRWHRDGPAVRPGGVDERGADPVAVPPRVRGLSTAPPERRIRGRRPPFRRGDRDRRGIPASGRSARPPRPPDARPDVLHVCQVTMTLISTSLTRIGARRSGSVISPRTTNVNVADAELAGTRTRRRTITRSVTFRAPNAISPGGATVTFWEAPSPYTVKF